MGKNNNGSEELNGDETLSENLDVAGTNDTNAKTSGASTVAPAPMEAGGKVTLTLVVHGVTPQPTANGVGNELIEMHVVSAADRDKEANSFSDGTLMNANFSMHVSNPDLVGTIKQGDYFDVELTKRKV